ncbi:MAG: CoB--CoM heterodisulfide reductase iron-sulfur subunit B family protein [Anaerolineae bacterium]|nr:CoB--CoM heterodisulfide reductase iron-sulfur subunit B family protein [Anaerolineae bacterium]
MTANANGSYAYYPGCSLTKNAAAYDVSSRVIARALGFELNELTDWNCCGASEYFSLNQLPAYALVARNLALTASEGAKQVVAPCSLCYVNLYKTDKYMGDHADLNEKVNAALAAGKLAYRAGDVKVRHLLDVVVNDVGFDNVAAAVKKPLYNLRVAPYYGCLIVRPRTGFDDVEYPTTMDHLMEVLGATVVDFPLKAECCGGHMTQISDDVALELIRRLLHNATEYEADAIVTVCPMCQLNLDAYQDQVNRRFGTRFKMPILYFTQVMGLAFGMEPKAVAIGKEIVDARPALAKVTAEPPVQPKKKRRDKSALPMPSTEREG